MANPTPPPERIAVIDVLRGAALLGILTMNITLGQPGVTRLNPLIAGSFESANFMAWIAGYFLFDDKMITLFSLLFGAGIGLFASRLEQRGIPPTRLFYRRSVILLFIGLAHAYLLWEGDILVTYAICGMLVYLLRNRPVTTLLITAAVLWLVSVPLTIGFSEVLRSARDSHSALWSELTKTFQPNPAEVARQIQSVRHAGYLQLLRERAPEAFNVQTQLLLVSFLWTVSARMLLGLALWKSGSSRGESNLFSISKRLSSGTVWVGPWLATHAPDSLGTGLIPFTCSARRFR